MIFETNTLNIGDGVPVDDVLETVHHFRAIDYVIDSADEILSEDIIKKVFPILCLRLLYILCRHKKPRTDRAPRIGPGHQIRP